MDGEINLSTCFDITDYPAQKDCGFQIHVSSIVAQIYSQIDEQCLSSFSESDNILYIIILSCVL